MQVSFRTIQLTDGKKRVNGALRARAAVRPALRQGSAFLLGLAGGWAVLYGWALQRTASLWEPLGPHWGCWPGVSER